MNLSFSIPLKQAWERMTRMLFRPFRLETWLVLGFAAFLSEFLSGRSGSAGSWRSHHNPALHGVARGVEAFLLHPVWTGIVLVLLSFAVVAVIVVHWLSCRGRFVFLHNVVEEKAGIVEPWKRFARLGDSLFVWTLVFMLVCITLAIAIVLPFLAAILALWSNGQFRWEGLGAILGFVAMIVPFALLFAITVLFLNHFVVPIMYRQGVSASRAWSVFLALFRAQPGGFVLYALFMLVMGCIVAAGVLTVGISTCCVGFLLIGTPYVGQVILLPVHVFFRGFGPHFLAQLGPEYDVFAGAAHAPTDAPGVTR